jgi:hypothetical protein
MSGQARDSGDWRPVQQPDLYHCHARHEGMEQEARGAGQEECGHGELEPPDRVTQVAVHAHRRETCCFIASEELRGTEIQEKDSQSRLERVRDDSEDQWARRAGDGCPLHCASVGRLVLPGRTNHLVSPLRATHCRPSQHPDYSLCHGFAWRHASRVRGWVFRIAWARHPAVVTPLLAGYLGTTRKGSEAAERGAVRMAPVAADSSLVEQQAHVRCDRQLPSQRVSTTTLTDAEDDLP